MTKQITAKLLSPGVPEKLIFLQREARDEVRPIYPTGNTPVIVHARHAYIIDGTQNFHQPKEGFDSYVELSFPLPLKYGKFLFPLSNKSATISQERPHKKETL